MLHDIQTQAQIQQQWESGKICLNSWTRNLLLCYYTSRKENEHQDVSDWYNNTGNFKLHIVKQIIVVPNIK